MHRYVVQAAADIALTAATAKTALQLVTGATRRLKVCEIGIGFSSVTSTDAAVLAELRLQTTAGTSVANTPTAIDRLDPAAIFTANDTVSVEPTDGGLIGPGPWRITPIGGLFVYQFPAGQELVMAISTRVGLRLTAPATQASVRAYLICQE